MNTNPLVTLIAGAPAVPEWFEPRMPPRPNDQEAWKNVPTGMHSSVPIIFLHGKAAKEMMVFPSMAEFAEKYGDILQQARQWEIENSRQWLLQWPLYWAQEQLKLIQSSQRFGLWIPFTEQEPLKSDMVLACKVDGDEEDSNYDCAVIWFEPSEDCWIRGIDDCLEGLPAIGFTHWMPLPLPPSPPLKDWRAMPAKNPD